MKDILPCTGHDLKYPDIIKADNCSLYDAHGVRYLDLESGVWCTSVGHSHPRVVKTIADQSAKIMHTGYCYLNPVIETAAGKILRITGLHNGQCVFLCSGSEAVEFAVTITRRISDKPYILTLHDSYLSAFGSACAKSADDWILFDWMNHANLDAVPFDKIAAFVFEPGSSSGQVHFPPVDLIRTLVDRVRDHQGLIIANEVTTGIGRTGKWFGYNHYDIIPDIVAVGKGLGNGYPVSSTVLAPHVVHQLDLHSFHYAQSHQNDPLGAAVANEVISIIEENNLLSACYNNGKALRTGLNAIKEKYGIIKEVRGRGLMMAVEFEHHAAMSYARMINDALLKQNIILVKRPGYEIFRMDPALTIEQDDIDYFLKSMEEIIAGLVG